MKKLFSTDRETAEEYVRLAVNKRLWLGRYLLLFPHIVEGRTFRTTLIRKLLCWGAAVALEGCCILISILHYKRRVYFKFLFWAPMQTSFLTILINQAWMHSKKATLDHFLSCLQKCRPYFKVDEKQDMMKNLLPIFLLSVLYFGFWLMLTLRFGLDIISVSFFCNQLGSVLCTAMVEQFILLLSLVRQQLSRTNILSDLDHDALIAAALDLNEVFSPHILVTIMVIFVTQLGKINANLSKEVDSNYVEFVLVVFQSLPVWRIVSNCQQFTKEVEQSYNRTYSHMLNQRHRIEKRMELHLSMRKKFVFSACGFFDLDYELIRGMITTVVTYTVVLLQFKTT